MTDITRLSYWYPKLVEAGLPTPQTHLIKASEEEQRAIWESFETTIQPGVEPLARRVKEAADMLGYPAFLRTDYFSGKHNWSQTCYLIDSSDIARHIIEIAYFWECVNMLAPPSDMWVVREFLPTIPRGICVKYGEMPICKEYRFFVEDGKVLCWHPYWPKRALAEGGAVYSDPDFDYALFSTPSNVAQLTELASAAGAAVGGKWSIDLLETEKGWFITDMAEAHKSYHWEGCPYA